MLTFPLYYVAIPFLVLIGIWAIFAFFNIFHTLKFGFVNYISYLMTFIFLGASIVILFLTYQAFIETDWQEIITITYLN